MDKTAQFRILGFIRLSPLPLAPLSMIETQIDERSQHREAAQSGAQA